MAVRFQYRGKKLKEATLGEVAEDLVVEGIGVGGGFIANAALGRQIQNLVKKDDKVVNMTDKLIAWGGNNVPKIAIWYLLRDFAKKEMIKTKPGEKNLTANLTSDISKSAIGSVMFDTLVRAFNGGKNPVNVKMFGYQVLDGQTENRNFAMRNSTMQNNLQKLIQENSSLRSELNKSLQRLANQPRQIQQPQQSQPQIHVQPQVQIQPARQPPVVTVQPIMDERERRYGFMPTSPLQTTPEAEQRRRQFGAMPTYDAPPVVEERERKYGFAGGKGGEEQIAAMFGML
jgi:hypothetical protein